MVHLGVISGQWWLKMVSGVHLCFMMVDEGNKWTHCGEMANYTPKRIRMYAKQSRFYSINIDLKILLNFFIKNCQI